VEALRARGLAWVLGRQRLEVGTAVRAGERLEIETWPSGASGVAALRDFLVRRGGAEVARASTVWFVMDLARRRPVRLDRVLDERFRERPARSAPPPADRLEPAGEGGATRRFSIRYLDIDANQHVTNTSYLAWALEAVPEEVWRGCRLAVLEAHYLAECRYGSAIRSRASASGEGEYRHAVVREEDGKELARLWTRWVAR
jgi:medium-chain acyl-[acyl-carrier-protein] hydrolase